MIDLPKPLVFISFHRETTLAGDQHRRETGWRILLALARLAFGPPRWLRLKLDHITAPE
jgi:hypothetical protein